MSDYAGFVDDTFAVGDLQPSQWKDLWHHINEPSPEVRLLTAILEDALRCYQGHPGNRTGQWKYRSHRATRQHLEAHRWIFDDEGDYRFSLSFAQVCETLGIDAGALRARLRQAAPIHVMRSRPRQGNMAVRGRREG